MWIGGIYFVGKYPTHLSQHFFPVKICFLVGVVTWLRLDLLYCIVQAVAVKG